MTADSKPQVSHEEVLKDAPKFLRELAEDTRIGAVPANHILNIAAAIEAMREPTKKRIMFNPQTTLKILHEECPDCRGVCDPYIEPAAPASAEPTDTYEKGFKAGVESVWEPPIHVCHDNTCPANLNPKWKTEPRKSIEPHPDALIERIVAALRGILDIGKRDMSNPKYDGYFETAEAALREYEQERSKR